MQCLNVGFRITSHWDDDSNGPSWFHFGGIDNDHITVQCRTRKTEVRKTKLGVGIGASRLVAWILDFVGLGQEVRI